MKALIRPLVRAKHEEVLRRDNQSQANTGRPGRAASALRRYYQPFIHPRRAFQACYDRLLPLHTSRRPQSLANSFGRANAKAPLNTCTRAAFKPGDTRTLSMAEGTTGIAQRADFSIGWSV